MNKGQFNKYLCIYDELYRYKISGGFSGSRGHVLPIVHPYYNNFIYQYIVPPFIQNLDLSMLFFLTDFHSFLSTLYRNVPLNLCPFVT